MNIQDVADFISLVKDPAKFERHLKQLVDEQDRLKAVIETVGKVEEIESIKTQIKLTEQKELQKQQALLAKYEQERTKEAVSVAILQEEARLTREKYQNLLQELQANEKETKALNTQAKKREKDLEKKQTELQETIAATEKVKLDYEERLTKLKSVMV